MKRRRSILLDDRLDRRIERLARQHGRTFTEEVRDALERHVGPETENPSQWLLDLADEMARLGPPRPGPRIDIDSGEGKLQAARDIYRDTMNREPDV